MPEKELIAKILALPQKRDRDVLLGIGDDAAIVRGPDDDYVITKDTMVEGTHFKRPWLSPKSIGWRLAAVNLSDIAAMGGRPRFALLSLCVPRHWSERSVLAIEKGAAEHLRDYGATIVGGNVTSTRGSLVCDMTLIGSVDAGAGWTRKARVGDAVVLVGRVGEAAAGVRLLSHSSQSRSSLVTAYRRPRPRVDAARRLAKTKSVNAAIDVSDGLSTDLIHMCDAGDVGVRIDASEIPVSRVLERFCKSRRLDTLEWTMSGGEDYALLMSIDASRAREVCRRLALADRAAIIGEFTRDRRRVVYTKDGGERMLKSTGWDHLR